MGLESYFSIQFNLLGGSGESFKKLIPPVFMLKLVTSVIARLHIADHNLRSMSGSNGSHDQDVELTVTHQVMLEIISQLQGSKHSRYCNSCTIRGDQKK